MQRREFLAVLAAAAAAGMTIDSKRALAAGSGMEIYDSPSFGNVSFLHFTDCHAQLTPSYFREPSVNLGIAGAVGNPPHLVGEALLKRFGIRPGTREAHAFTYLDFAQGARTYGKVGGFAHLATLVKQIRATPPIHCCSMAATPGRVRRLRSGLMARTWWMPANCWAST